MYICCTVYRSASSERETETEVESLSCAMDTGEASMIEDSSDFEFSEDTTADDGTVHTSTHYMYLLIHAYSTN